MKTRSSATQSVGAGLAKRMLGAGMGVGISAGIKETGGGWVSLKVRLRKISKRAEMHVLGTHERIWSKLQP
jgi:hypothetical protein